MDAIKAHELARGRSPLVFNSVDEVLYFVLVHSYIQNNEFYEKLDILQTKRIPTLVVYGQSDKLVPKDNFERLVTRLGADPSDTTLYSDDILNTIPDHNKWIKAVALKTGGHFGYNRFSQIVGKHLQGLLSSEHRFR